MQNRLFMAMCVLSGVLASGAGWAEGTLDKVKAAGVLVAGVPEDAPPFAFRDAGSGQIVGHDVDFVAAMANRMGVRLRLRAVTESDRLAALLDGTVDILAAALTQTEARSAVMSFSDPYVVSGQKVIARKGEVQELDDLSGKKIGAVVGTFAETCVRDRCTVSRLVPFDDYVAGIEALASGKIDAFSADETILVDLFQGLPSDQFEIPDVLIVRDEYRMGLRKGDAPFLAAVNQAIRTIQEDGEAERLRRQWFAPQDRALPPAYGSIVRRATTRPRFLGVALSGALHPSAEVMVFTIGGEELGKGTISSVFGDEFYVDVEERIYNLIQPGSLVTMNMNTQMAMDVLMRRRGVLDTVKTEAEQEAKAVREELNEAAEAKRQRAIEMDTFRERLEESARSDRTRYFRYYDRRRFR